MESASSETIIPSNAQPVCNKPLPPIDPEHEKNASGSILLFYQYIEPQWSSKQHKLALKKVIEIGTKYSITGRGRVATEGLNCTLTGTPHNIRNFCYALREWNDVFNETDFKITDGISKSKMFRSSSFTFIKQ